MSIKRNRKNLRKKSYTWRFNIKIESFLFIVNQRISEFTVYLHPVEVELHFEQIFDVDLSGVVYDILIV